MRLSILETTHLILEKIVEGDIDLYLRMYKCPETTKYLPNRKPYSDETSASLWQNGLRIGIQVLELLLFLKNRRQTRLVT